MTGSVRQAAATRMSFSHTMSPMVPARNPHAAGGGLEVEVAPCWHPGEREVAGARQVLRDALGGHMVHLARRLEVAAQLLDGEHEVDAHAKDPLEPARDCAVNMVPGRVDGGLFAIRVAHLHSGGDRRLAPGDA